MVEHEFLASLDQSIRSGRRWPYCLFRLPVASWISSRRFPQKGPLAADPGLPSVRNTRHLDARARPKRLYPISSLQLVLDMQCRLCTADPLQRRKAMLCEFPVSPPLITFSAPCTHKKTEQPSGCSVQTITLIAPGESPGICQTDIPIIMRGRARERDFYRASAHRPGMQRAKVTTGLRRTY